MWTIGEHTISTVAVVDDEKGSRESLGWMLSDADLEMREVDGPLRDIDSAQESAFSAADALICDHHLSVRNYAVFAGAELVARSVRAGSLAILCTRFIGPDIDDIRPLLQYIPVVRRPDELNEPKELYRALVLCADELDGNAPPQRRLWRAQLVVDRVDDSSFDVSVPSWELEESIRLRLEDVPQRLRPHVKVGFRTHVRTNLGAEEADQLFIESWEE